jgi:hypothetical protein
MNKLLLALLLTSNVAFADSWGEIANTLNDNIRTRAYANPPVGYIPPPVVIVVPQQGYNQVIPPAYIAPIQGNPNVQGYNYNTFGR